MKLGKEKLRSFTGLDKIKINYMENLVIKLNDVELYDAVIADSLPECGDLAVITKDGGMESGAAGAVITFTVQLPDGTIGRAQAATTVRLLISLGAALSGRYGDASGEALIAPSDTVLSDDIIERND